MSTVANAYVYFEKLILGHFVCKANRKHVAGVCLVLATKFHDPRGNRFLETGLLEAIAQRFGIEKSDLLAFEFPLFAALRFALHTRREDIAVHLSRLWSTEVLRDYREHLYDLMND